jgi:hypothetical protein
VSSAPPASTTTTSPACTVSPLLVSSCQVWFGDAPQSHYVTASTQTQRLAYDEGYTGRDFDILHQYQTNGTLFPNAETIGLAQQGRILFENWKPATDMTWAQVAAGQADGRIDAEAAYLKAHFTAPFFLAIYHEPEDNVVSTPGSGMTTADYVAMYRHVVLRLRADGVSNAVTVMDYMGYYRWDPMRDALYPGDDVVDWIGLDSYVSVEKGYYHYGDFGSLLDRQPTGGGLGFYQWSVTNHPSKPIMVAEWGMYHRVAYPTSKAAAFQSVVPQLAKHPQVKGVVYFDTAADATGDRNIAVDSTPDSLTAFKQVAANPIFNVKINN